LQREATLSLSLSLSLNLKFLKTLGTCGPAIYTTSFIAYKPKIAYIKLSCNYLPTVYLKHPTTACNPGRIPKKRSHSTPAFNPIHATRCMKAIGKDIWVYRTFNCLPWGTKTHAKLLYCSKEECTVHRDHKLGIE
jgi:hypothetical protein